MRLPRLQQIVNLLRLQFDLRPKDTPNAPTNDARIDRWYRSIGLFEGHKNKKPISVHLLKAFDESHYALLINGKELKTIYGVSDMRLAKARSDKEKKEIYDKWKSLINMSQEALDKWAENPARLEASLNRERAKEEGGIQSGLDSLHRIKRRKSKPFKEWSDSDFDNASQENGFNSRMIGGKIGQPVGSTGMSKWEISLRNWGHDPNLSSSPANSKYNAWKKANKDAIAKSKAKANKKSSQRVAHRYLFG